jgi:hypothetical protein
MSQRTTRIIAAVLLTLVLLVIVGSGYVWRRQSEAEQRERERIACQERYNEANNARTRALTEVTASERVAERRWRDALNALFKDPSLRKARDEQTAEDRARVQRLFLEYLARIDQLEREQRVADVARVANPVPPPPSAVCG